MYGGLEAGCGTIYDQLSTIATEGIVSSLVISAEEDHLQANRKLIAAGEYANLPSQDCIFPLVAALLNGHLEVRKQ